MNRAKGFGVSAVAMFAIVMFAMVACSAEQSDEAEVAQEVELSKTPPAVSFKPKNDYDGTVAKPGAPYSISYRIIGTAGRNGNRLSEHRFLRFTTLASSAYEVNIVPNPIPPPTTDPTPTPPDVIRDRSDPDIFIYRDGQLVAVGNSGDDDVENFTTLVLPADTYAVDLQEFRYADEDGASSDFPEQICFDVSMTPQ